MTFVWIQASNLPYTTEFTTKAKHGNMQDVIFTFLEPMRHRVPAQQWLDQFVMFTMELSVVPHSVQVPTCALLSVLFILNGGSGWG